MIFRGASPPAASIGSDGVYRRTSSGLQSVDPQPQFFVLPAHAPPVPCQLRPRRSLIVSPPRLEAITGAGAEVGLWVPRLHRVLPAERHPQCREPGSLGDRVAREQSATVVRDVARELLCGVVRREDGEDGVHGHQWWLLLGVNCGHEYIHGRKHRLVERSEVDDAADRLHLGHLVEHPHQGKPELPSHGHHPHPKNCAFVVGACGANHDKRSADSPLEEQHEDAHPENYHEPV
uniref:Uncharacterized protein n=1 Tax=Zea mays TaxID=4577 RepID=C4J4P0_MAIZE|nr:unknown [Zea mays]